MDVHRWRRLFSQNMGLEVKGRLEGTNLRLG